ncbi:SAM complex subunit [Saccharomycopsis crataegensis]|uniref:SAM complex subunit n=1 Tax=Saccharomycopsis crataegensis TaxID=43959 RepID=A0AAV5QJR7_9ASCO|nr:SAM complex subunit [Saccharomycopsis crataegensis]
MSIEDVTHGESLTERIQHGSLKEYQKKSKVSEVEQLQTTQTQLLDQQRKTVVEGLLADNRLRLVDIPQVIVNNSEYYRTTFLNQQLSPLLTNGNRLTIEDFLQKVDLVTKNLVNCTNTENLLVNIEALPKQQTFWANNDRESISLIPVFNLLPVKRFFAKTGTSVGNGEGNGYITLQLRNFLKGGENLIFDATIGTRTRTSYLLNLNFPINNNAFLRSENLAFMNSRKIEWASHDQILKGISNKIIKYGIGNINDPKNFHEQFTQEWSFENVWRSVAVLDKAASDAVLLNCGDDFKSSFLYNIKYDDRENKMLAQSGKMWKFQVEYAPSFFRAYQHSNFLKYSFESVFAQPLTNRTFCNFSFRGGMLQNLSSFGYCNIMDKFNIGGPTDVRGFNYNGLGPRAATTSSNKNFGTSMGDRVGGDFYYSTGLSLFTTIPKIAPTSEHNLKFHSFVNAGKLVNLNGENNGGVKDLLKEPSVSIGCGLLYNHPAARFELNFTLPVTAHESDAMRKGIQYGIGLSFL